MSEQLRKTAAILLAHAEHGVGQPFPQWLVDCRRDVEAAAENPPPNSKVVGVTDEFIERVAIHLHTRDADDQTLKWAKQPGKYRASLRRDVRDVIASLGELGFSVVKTSIATKEASDV